MSEHYERLRSSNLVRLGVRAHRLEMRVGGWSWRLVLCDEGWRLRETWGAACVQKPSIAEINRCWRACQAYFMHKRQCPVCGMERA